MAADEFTFDVEADRRAQEAVGERFVTSETMGADTITTDTPEAREAEARERAHPTPESPPGADEAEQLRQQVERYKSEMGRQAQALGEKAKAAEAQSAQLQQRLQLLEAQQQAAQRAQQAEQVFDVFQGISDEDLYNPQVLRRTLSEKFVHLAQATQAELNNVRTEGQYFAARTASGVTPAEEAELAQEYPWLSGLQGAQKAEALVQMAQTRRTSQGAPQQTANEAARLAARQGSYVEASSPVSSESDVASEPTMDKLLRDTKTGKFRTTEELERAMTKAGIGRVDDYGRSY